MRKFIVAALFATSALAAVPAQAQITYYTDYAAFLAALGGVPLIEDFEDATLVSGLQFTSNAGSISGGVWNDRVTPAADVTAFSFGQAINGFGGFFDLTPGGPGLGIAITTIPGQTLALEVANTYAGGFYGFISTAAFGTVTLSGGTQNLPNAVAETYTLDNMTFGAQAAVPEPAAWGMMIGGFGLAGMALRNRRRVRTTVTYA